MKNLHIMSPILVIVDALTQDVYCSGLMSKNGLVPEFPLTPILAIFRRLR